MHAVKSVIIVDDDPSHLRIYAWIVEAASYQALTATVHHSHVQLPEADQGVDLVLLDYHLSSQISATEIAHQIKARFPSAPIVVLSDELFLPEDIAPHVQGFVRKGDPAKLVDTLHSYLRPAE